MESARFSLHDYPPGQKTSLENMLDETNHQYNRGFHSLNERQSLLFHRKRRYNESLKTAKKRINDLMNYSNELEMKQNMIITSQENLEAQTNDANEKIDHEITICERTLIELQHEYELLIQKYNYCKSNSIKLNSQINELQIIDNNLSERIAQAKRSIAKSEENMPKRSPENIRKEMLIVQKNIPQVKTQIELTEDDIVQKEINKIKMQTEISSLKEKIAMMKLDVSEKYQNGDAKNESIRCSIASKLERMTALDSLQNDKTSFLRRLQERINYQIERDKKLTINLKVSAEKIEELTNLINKKEREKKVSSQQIKETKEATKKLMNKRRKNDLKKTSEFFQIRDENMSFQKKCESEMYKLKLIKIKKKELKETLKKLNDLFQKSEEDAKVIKLENKEITKLMNEKKEKDQNEERQFKLDLISLDDLQKNIAREELNYKQLMNDRMNLLDPPFVDSPKPMKFSHLKKKIKAIKSDVEILRFQYAKLKAQKNVSKQEILLKRLDLEHAKNVHQYLEHEKAKIIPNELEDKLVDNKAKDFDNMDLMKQIEKKHEEILERKRAMQVRTDHINSVINDQRIIHYGSNVSLIVSKDYPRTIQRITPEEYEVDKIINYDKLLHFYRRVQIEQNIWSGYVNDISISGILETWADELQQY